jgi:hypothetical protein
MVRSKLFKIIVFDDGNQQFEHFTNSWIITASRFKGEKITLKNSIDQTIIIKSISSWKVNPIIDSPD